MTVAADSRFDDLFGARRTTGRDRPAGYGETRDALAAELTDAGLLTTSLTRKLDETVAALLSGRSYTGEKCVAVNINTPTSVRLTYHTVPDAFGYKGVVQRHHVLRAVAGEEVTVHVPDRDMVVEVEVDDVMDAVGQLLTVAKPTA